MTSGIFKNPPQAFAYVSLVKLVTSGGHNDSIEQNLLGECSGCWRTKLVRGHKKCQKEKKCWGYDALREH